MWIAECWIEHPVRDIDRPFTYLCEEVVVPGARVRVPFGPQNLVGFVEKVSQTTESKDEIEKRLGMELKFVDEVLDRQSLLTEELHDLALWMARETLATAISCFQAILPGKIKPRRGERPIVYEKTVSAADTEADLTPRQQEALAYVRSHQPLTYTKLRALFPGQVKALKDKGVVIIGEREKEAAAYTAFTPTEKQIPTAAQQTVLDEIRKSDDPVYLLRGVTGSGKTEIYLQLAEEALARGKQVLFLVPEIGLTPQMIERVAGRFGGALAIYHSRLNEQEKYEQYRMVKAGRASVVVGTRSAVFMPFDDLGLIVMDEEQDASYKQDDQPAYHCRDVALWRGRYHHCKVILGSATPSLDSYARALKHVYHPVRLDERINGDLAEVEIVSVRDDFKKGGTGIISSRLQEEMAARLMQNEQIILLLNRRGYHRLLRCRCCGKALQCPHCDLLMSWHKDIKRLKCHSCGYQSPIPEVCPSCGGRQGYGAYGFGTERLEQEAASLFPASRIMRMDADTTTRKNSHEKMLASFGRHEYDILLGTQMIAKGLDYPDVTLVGIINGDEGLQRTDFHSCETTFDLLMQAVGRSGRADKKGKALIQVFEPDHYAVRCAAAQDYDTFFAKEMRFRHAGQYPPYTYLISLTFTGSSKAKTEAAATAFKNCLKGNFKILGVISLYKQADLARARLVLKGKDLDEMRDAVRLAIRGCGLSLAGLKINIGPMSLD